MTLRVISWRKLEGGGGLFEGEMGGGGGDSKSAANAMLPPAFLDSSLHSMYQSL